MKISFTKGKKATRTKVAQCENVVNLITGCAPCCGVFAGFTHAPVIGYSDKDGKQNFMNLFIKCPVDIMEYNTNMQSLNSPHTIKRSFVPFFCLVTMLSNQ